MGSSYISLLSQFKSQKKRMLKKRFEQPLLEESNGSKIAELPTLPLSTVFSYRKSEWKDSKNTDTIRLFWESCKEAYAHRDSNLLLT